MGRTVLYVSVEGNDAWSGRKPAANAAKTDGPFATLARARDAVRALKADGKLAGPVTVSVRGGTYYLAEPLVFGPEDSGRPDAPITYAAYEGERPVLSGGTRITGWRTGEGGRWVADLPGVKEGTWRFRQLFVNGERRGRPRLPKEGFFRIAGLPGADMAKAPWQNGSDRFVYAEGDLRPDWHNLADVEIVALHFWTDAHLPIAAVDPATRTVTLARKSKKRLSDDFSDQGARYYAENVLEAIRPGEWYLDRKAGTLTYVPRPGEDPATTEVIAGRLPALVRFEGRPAERKPVERIALVGLTFRHTEWDLPPDDGGDLQAANTVPGAIFATGGHHLAIERCTLEHLGTYGVDLADGCMDVRVVGSEFADLGGGGIKISGGRGKDPPETQTRSIQFADNHVHHGGQVWNSAVGVLLRHASDCTISHNEIDHLYYTGVSVGWVWGYGESVSTNNCVEANHIHDLGQGLLSDMGGIYTLGVSPGTVLRSNVIHDVQSYGYGGWGLYTDEGSTGILLENNVVYRTKTGGFHQHYGKENTLRNNIFAFAAVGQIQRTRPETHTSFTFERNIVYWKEGPLLHGNWEGGYRFDRNVYWNAAGGKVDFAGKSLEEWQKAGQDAHAVVADPQFADPERGDFALAPGSPALNQGFQPIDTSQVGPRKGAAK